MQRPQMAFIMKKPKYLILLFLLSIITLLIALFDSWALTFKGFPDGGRTTSLDLINEKVIPVYIIIELLFPLLFLYIGWNFKKESNRKKMIWAIIAFLSFLILKFIINYYISLKFDDEIILKL